VMNIMLAATHLDRTTALTAIAIALADGVSRRRPQGAVVIGI